MIRGRKIGLLPSIFEWQFDISEYYRCNVPRLTVIIPFLESDSVERFEETLASFLEFRTEETDLLVLNGCAYDDNYGIKDEEGVCFQDIPAKTSYLDALNQGIQLARTELVHPVLCGAVARDNWTEPALARFDNPHVMAVIPLILEVLDDNNQEKPLVHSGFAYERSGRAWPVMPGFETKPWLQHAPHFAGAFYRKNILNDLGGFYSSFGPIFSFIDMTLLIAALGGRTVLEIKSRLYQQKGRFDPWIPNKQEWLVQQERLYSRWADWGGNNGFRHRTRIFWEALANFWHGGKMSQIFDAYRNGADQNAISLRKDLISKVQNLHKNEFLE